MADNFLVIAWTDAEKKQQRDPSGLSAFIVVIAAISFVIDFAAIEQAIAEGVEERQGWHFAFALLVGLIWLYIEILRLLSKLRSRD